MPYPNREAVVLLPDAEPAAFAAARVGEHTVDDVEPRESDKRSSCGDKICVIVGTDNMVVEAAAESTFVLWLGIRTFVLRCSTGS